MTRKNALKTLALGTAAITASATQTALGKEAEEPPQDDTLKNNINHSFCRWCYNKIPLEELLDSAKDMGINAIDLLWPDEWSLAIDRGMTVSMSFGSKLGIPKGFNDPQYHQQLLEDFEALIPRAADAGLERIICFSGNRNGISDEAGIEHCAKGLAPVLKLAEKYDVEIVMELLNSKVNHPDYQCDHTAWGVALAKKLGSEKFKLLYDIYHMQIMEGDIIATIQEYHPYISHYHTGGVPGRHEIDETQELYYPAIMKAIVDTGYKGFVAQEFIPAKEDALASLKASVQICDV